MHNRTHTLVVYNLIIIVGHVLFKQELGSSAEP